MSDSKSLSADSGCGDFSDLKCSTPRSTELTINYIRCTGLLGNLLSFLWNTTPCRNIRNFGRVRQYQKFMSNVNEWAEVVIASFSKKNFQNPEISQESYFVKF